MNKLDSIVIAGGGLAGATAAFAIRERGFEGRVTLVGQENSAPYERPPLSKSYLRGDSTLDQALVRPLADYAAHGIELLLAALPTRLEAALSLAVFAPMTIFSMAALRREISRSTAGWLTSSAIAGQ